MAFFNLYGRAYRAAEMSDGGGDGIGADTGRDDDSQDAEDTKSAATKEPSDVDKALARIAQLEREVKKAQAASKQKDKDLATIKRRNSEMTQLVELLDAGDPREAVKHAQARRAEKEQARLEEDWREGRLTFAEVAAKIRDAGTDQSAEALSETEKQLVREREARMALEAKERDRELFDSVRGHASANKNWNQNTLDDLTMRAAIALEHRPVLDSEGNETGEYRIEWEDDAGVTLTGDDAIKTWVDKFLSSENNAHYLKPVNGGFRVGASGGVDNSVEALSRLPMSEYRKRREAQKKASHG